MKKSALILLLGLLAPAARAQTAPVPTTGVAQQYASTMSCVAVQVASATATGNQATAMLSTATNKLWRAVSIQNQDATNNLFCSDAITVSSRTGTGFASSIGWTISASTPSASASFILVPGEQWYCVNDSTTRSTIAVACKGY